MKEKHVFIFFLLAIALIGGIYYFFFSNTAKRKKEIKRILATKLTFNAAAASGKVTVTPWTAELLKDKTLVQLIAIK